MTLIDWSDRYNVNVQKIDSEHERMVALVNELHEVMKSSGGRDALNSMLTNLIAYTQLHFSTEEGLMTDHRYPGYAKHKAEHDDLIEQVLDFEQQFRGGDMLLSFAIALQLKGWAMKHIASSDKELGAFLNKKSIF